MTRNGSSTSVAKKNVRCAIYTRKSTEEGLQQEFNSLDAQREAAEAFIASQLHEGWICLPERYDDGGFTGGNLDRPAMQRLMADIDAGKIDTVLVYKVDRLSRSLLDFARLMERFDKRQIAFVSVTQQFNTAHSMGRLMLNVLLSFAQFEREVIAERTRDKIAATRRKGKWTGGRPPLGYDVNERTKLVVNEVEAARVREIFVLYLEQQRLVPVLRELERRQWLNKTWTKRSGTVCPPLPFTKSALRRLLTNVVYVGKLGYKDEVHPGEQPAIVDAATFAQVGQLLSRNGATGGADRRSDSNALLQGLIRCKACQCSMCPAHTTKGQKRYRYYTCSAAQRRGWDSCPSKSVPAGPMEKLVIDRLRSAGRDPELVRGTMAELRRHDEQRLAEIEAEHRGLNRDLLRWHAEISTLVAANHIADKAAHLADLHERVASAQQRLAVLHSDRRVLHDRAVDEAQATRTLAAFEPVWAALTPREQHELIRLLVERVEFDGAAGTVTMTFHPAGLRGFTEQFGIQELRA